MAVLFNVVYRELAQYQDTVRWSSCRYQDFKWNPLQYQCVTRNHHHFCLHSLDPHMTFHVLRGISRCIEGAFYRLHLGVAYPRGYPNRIQSVTSPGCALWEVPETVTPLFSEILIYDIEREAHRFSIYLLIKHPSPRKTFLVHGQRTHIQSKLPRLCTFFEARILTMFFDNRYITLFVHIPSLFLFFLSYPSYDFSAVSPIPCEKQPVRTMHYSLHLFPSVIRIFPPPTYANSRH